MKARHYIFLFILLIISSKISATEYILFDEDNIHKSTEVNPFKLYYNYAEISHKTKKGLNWTIYNLYYTRNDFELNPIYGSNLLEAYRDYKKFYCDVLVSLTPLYLKNEQRDFIELKGKTALDTITFITQEQLLQKAIRETYGVDFAGKNPCLPEDLKERMTGHVKSLDYKLVIKRAGKYYLCRNTILTEFYYVSTSGFLFPNEPGFCGIYRPFPSQIYTSDYIENELLRKGGFGSLAETFTLELSGKLFCSGYDTLSNLRLTNHWMRSPRGGLVGPYKYFYKSFQTKPYIVRNGSNHFQFLERIGIINGNYEFYLFDPMRNRQTDAPQDTEGVNFDFDVISINNKPVKDFSAWYQQKYPPVIRVME